LKEKRIMTALDRLFAGALVATIMALPAYAQSQTDQRQTSQPQPVQQSVQPPSAQPPVAQPQTGSVPRIPQAPADAATDTDAVTDGEAVNENVTLEDSAILPSAGGHEASRAPSMELDCEKKPEDCVEPLTSDSPGPTLSTTPSAR
jgi:hypothetical protein